VVRVPANVVLGRSRIGVGWRGSTQGTGLKVGLENPGSWALDFRGERRRKNRPPAHRTLSLVQSNQVRERKKTRGGGREGGR